MELATKADAQMLSHRGCVNKGGKSGTVDTGLEGLEMRWRRGESIGGNIFQDQDCLYFSSKLNCVNCLSLLSA